jgi:hypothetical protein
MQAFNITRNERHKVRTYVQIINVLQMYMDMDECRQMSMNEIHP